eukprot:jgi/Mesvir1/10057/Mv12126-RA.1
MQMEGNKEPVTKVDVGVQSSDASDSSRLRERLALAQQVRHVGVQQQSPGFAESALQHDDPHIKEDIIRMILQYLQNEGYTASMVTIQDEANVKAGEEASKRSRVRRLKNAVLEGEWAEVEKICANHTFKNQKSFLYSLYKQQFLELIDQMEYEKAFTLLTKRLKPLEGREAATSEVRDMCYLLTCKSTHEVASFKNWEGVHASREKLLEQLSHLLDSEGAETTVMAREMQNDRLIHLLRQAVLYQIEHSRYHPKLLPKVTTLLEDYQCFVLPNALKMTLAGHRGNVKCVDFVGDQGTYIASGSSDNTVRVWDTEGGGCLQVLGEGGTGASGHTSRIWDVTSSASGQHLVSASGDATLKLWDLSHVTEQKAFCAMTLVGHLQDVYTAKFHPGGAHVVTGGYDKSVRLWDLATGQLVKTFAGHSASVSRVLFNPHGNLIISGSKDSTIKFWDILSGVCVNTFSSHLGEVTSVELNASGSKLLSGSKDNSNRLWDVRQARPIRRFKGHLNTSKNFVRSGFGPNEELIVGGSEDGLVYVWDLETGELLQRLGARQTDRHSMIAYRAVWSPQQSLLVSCSHDGTIKTWWYDEKVLLFQEEDEEDRC